MNRPKNLKDRSRVRGRPQGSVARDEGAGYFEIDPDLGGDEEQKRLRAVLIGVADNRIRNDPITKAACERLVSEGISEYDARMFIANLVSRDTWRVSHGQPPMDESEYVVVDPEVEVAMLKPCRTPSLVAPCQLAI